MDNQKSFEDNKYGSSHQVQASPVPLYTQYRIIQEIEKGTNKSELSRTYCLPRSTIGGIWKNRDAMRAHVKKKVSMLNRRNRRRRNDVDEALYNWYKIENALKVPISAIIMIQKAEEIAKELGIAHFTATNTWLQRFMARYKIALTKTKKNSEVNKNNVVEVSSSSAADSHLEVSEDADAPNDSCGAPIISSHPSVVDALKALNQLRTFFESQDVAHSVYEHVLSLEIELGHIVVKDMNIAKTDGTAKIFSV